MCALSCKSVFGIFAVESLQAFPLEQVSFKYRAGRGGCRKSRYMHASCVGSVGTEPEPPKHEEPGADPDDMTNLVSTEWK